MKADDVYRRHIKPLPAEERLRILELIGHDLAAIPAKPSRSIMELHGLGKDIWQGIDAQDYVDQLRDEWGRQP